VQANEAAVGVHNANLPILNRPSDPVLHVAAGARDELA
jgi:hypothetical protein